MENLALTNATSASFWRDKRVLLTGHTGFKGSWLTLWLHRLGAEVTGISLPPATAPNLYSEADIGALCQSRFCDIRDAGGARRSRPSGAAGDRFPFGGSATGTRGLSRTACDVRDQCDGHRPCAGCAAWARQRAGRRDGDDRQGLPRSRIARPYREDDALGGQDPYSASKAACEIVIASYRASFLSAQGVAVASARSGNVIGGGDWSDDRVIPDAVRAWQAGRILAGPTPLAVRPWQHVLEPLAAYLTLARKLWERSAPADAYNFGPGPSETVSVGELVEMARRAYGEGRSALRRRHRRPARIRMAHSGSC